MNLAFFGASTALFLLAAALLTRPLWWRFGAAGGEHAVRQLAQQMKQLRELHASGVLNDEQFAQSRHALEDRLVSAVSAPASSSSAAVPSRQLAGIVLGFVLVVAVAGYRFVGTPDRLAAAPADVATAPASTSAQESAHPVTPAQIQQMVDQLAERLKARPDDADGWVMLARSHVALGQHAKAVAAFRQATRLVPDDSALLADFADALAMSQERGLQGEPMALVERALKLDAKNVKALSLAGTNAFDNKDYAHAVSYWERAIALEPPGSAFSQQLHSGIAEARQLAGMPAGTLLAADAAPPGITNATGGASVAGTVTLPPELASRVSPNDTVFVFARAAEGSRMPLAILRKQVKDLPLRFVLDDSQAMSPEMKLSSVQRVVVGARISRSGNAMPQPGDLQGLTAPVDVGSSAVRIDIDQEIAK